MKKKLFIPMIIFAVIIVFVAVILLTSQPLTEPGLKDQGVSGDNIIMVSDDGGLELSIPAGAMPAGVEKSEIEIKPVEVERVVNNPEVVISGTLKAYELLPEGLEFKEPILVTMIFKSEAEKEGEFILPTLIHATETKAEIMKDTYYEIDLVQSLVRASASTKHFSVWTGDGYGGMVMNLWSPDQRVYTVGESFSVTLEISPSDQGDKEYEFCGTKKESRGWGYTAYSYVAGSDYEVNPDGTSYLKTRGIITPALAKIPYAKKKQKEVYKHKFDYTCAEAGYDEIVSHNTNEEYGFITVKHQRRIHEYGRGGHKEKSYVEEVQTGFRFTRDTGTASDEEFVASGYKCKEKMIRLGPPYLIDCSKGVILSGFYQADQDTGEMLKDANGNGFDYNTGKVVACP